MNDILWTPKQSDKEKTRLFDFLSYLKNRYALDCSDYQTLHLWSVDNKAMFWEAVFDYFKVKHNKKGEIILNNETNLLKASWFPDTKLNFAENILTRSDEGTALIGVKENGQRRTLSFKALHQAVASLQTAMRDAGIKKGMRVAALMPNTLETVIAMLAASSLGAIFSSCSPDFGIQGVLDRFGQIEPSLLFTVDGYQYHGKPIDIRHNVREISQKIPSIKKVIITPFLNETPDISTIPKSILYDTFLIPSDKLHFEPLAFNDPLYIMYSSGTTGVPKCIVHGVGGTLLQHIKELALHSNITDKDTFMYFTTCGWMMWNWFVSGLALGATLVLYDGSPAFPNLNRLFDMIDEESITAFGTSAKYLSTIEKKGIKPKTSHKLSSLKTIFSTGSPLSPLSFEYVYKDIKADLQLSSISGGTDIISCFALGNPMLPVYRGQLQCIGLGMDVAIFDDNGKALDNQKGELVCLSPFPSQPVAFWGDDDHQTKYKAAYFSRFKNVWAHGDYAKITPNFGVIIYGRSDTILNPGGVRIGTAEIYRQVEKIEEINDSVVIGQPYKEDVRVILFVVLKEGVKLDKSLIEKIKLTIKKNATPRHVPSKILAIPDVPRTISGKIAELAVRNAVMGNPINNLDALQNPESLKIFKQILDD